MRTTTPSSLRAQASPGRLRTAMLLGAIVFSSGSDTKAKPYVPMDLPRLIECRANVGDYLRLAMHVGGSGDSLGWVKVKQPNPFLAEFQLPKPITVFQGYQTRRIVFASSGVLAVLDGKRVSPRTLADMLDLAPVAAGSNRAMFAKVVKETRDDTARTLIRLNVSTVDSHPGKTLAGCEYTFDVK